MALDFLPFDTAIVLVVLGYMLCWYVLSLILKDASIVDIAWGIGFIAVAIAALVRDGRYLLAQLLIALLVLIWGLRLSWHIARRRIGKPEDWRYAAWRKEWGPWFALRSLVQVFLLQGAILLVIALPVLAVVAAPAPDATHPLALLGVLVWLVGFAFEAVGDHQLAAFVRQKKNKGQLMTTGLWRYTRHPNYFGEAVQWWGLALFALGAAGSWAAVASPLLLTFLLLKVSGVPMLEKKYEGRLDWEIYKERTSAFFPLPPKTVIARPKTVAPPKKKKRSAR